jgi:phospholipid/cholesterol/gamma-HCH transport system substrate-binding protein
MKRDSDHSINLFSGLLALAVITFLVLWFGAFKPLTTSAPQPGRLFVAYFDDAGGIEPGDAVRLKGRRAGRVTDVQLVTRDGRAQVRVEFEINPGPGSPWLREAAIPADSSIEVRVPRVFRRPQLAVTIGEDTENLIPEGGEWVEVKGLDSSDASVLMKEGVDRFRQFVDQFHEFLDAPTGLAAIEQSLESARAALQEADGQVSRFFGDVPDAGAVLDSTRAELDNLTAQIERGSRSLNEDLELAASGGLEAESALLRAESTLDGMLREVRRFEASTAAGAEQFERAGLAGLGIELRKQAARLRASMEIAKGDPSRGVSMPSWRRSRQFFSGDHPLPGGDPANEQGD